MIGFKFGTFTMQNPTDGITVHDTDVDNPPENDIQADELAERDGALIVQQRYRAKRFTVDGYIQKDSLLELKAALDVFKAALAVKNQAFDVNHGDGEIRRYLASVKNMAFSRSSPTTRGFSIEFLSPDGMGWGIDTSELLASTAISSSTLSSAVDVGGSYKAEPLIVVTLGAVTGGTAKTITISNGVTLRGLSVTRTWTAGDVLEIDSMNRTVYVNDVATDFSGQFPTWDTGAGTIEYLDDFTTRTAAIVASYTKRYL